MNNAFQAQVRHHQQTAIIDLCGDIDREAEAVLEQAYATAIANSPTAVLLNFAQVDYINSMGIALIVGLLAHARQAQVALHTCGLSDHYREIFRITRLSDFMPLFADETAALLGETSKL